MGSANWRESIYTMDNYAQELININDPYAANDYDGNLG